MTELRDNVDIYTSSPFSVRNQLGRFVWGLVWCLLFRPSPRKFHTWRVFLLRCFGARIGSGCHVYPSVTVWAPWNLHMEDKASMADGVRCYSMDKISIGARSVVSQNTHLCAGTHDYTKASFALITRPITIGTNVWVCADSFIHAGVSVGDGAVIGARSVVTADQPEWMVCAGHPCRPIKEREFDTQRSVEGQSA